MPEQWESDVDAAVRELLDAVPDMNDGTFDQGKVQLRAAISTADKAPVIISNGPKAVIREPSSAATRRHRARWLAAAAAVVALAAGGVVATQTVGSDVRLTSAGQVLRRAAGNIVVSSDQRVQEGQYRYIHNRGWTSVRDSGPSEKKEFVYRSEFIQENWIPADETGEWLSTLDYTGNHKWVVGTEEEAAAHGIRPVDPDWINYRKRASCGGRKRVGDSCAGEWHSPTPSWSENLPRDPDRMLKELRTEASQWATGHLAAHSDDAKALISVSQALDGGLASAPAEVRSALYRALAMMPELEITERQANLDGREGVALGMPGGDVRYDIIVDPDTGEYIGQRTVQTKPGSGIKPGTVLDSTSFRTAVVDKMGQRPPK